MRLDKIDKKILSLLDQNSRQSFSMIAKKINLSKERVRYRVRSYEEKGLLLSTFALVDYSLLGLHYYKVFLKLRATSPQSEVALLNFLRDELHVVTIFKCEGAFEFVFLVVCQHPKELHTTFMKLKTKSGSLILRKEIHQVVYSQQAPFADSKTTLPLVGGHTVQTAKSLSDVQKGILSKLASDARIPSVDIARSLQVTAKTVVENIALLQRDGFIVDFGAYLNIVKISWIKVIVNVNLERGEGAQRLITFFHEKGLLRFAHSVVGFYDLSLELWFENLNQYRKIILLFKNECSDLYAYYDVLFVLEESFYGYKLI